MFNNFHVNRKHVMYMLCIMACLIGLVGIKGIANAENQVEKKVESYLENRGVDRPSVTVDERIAKVQLISESAERRTLDDIKAVQAIYESVRSSDVKEMIDGVQIQVFDKDGVKVSDRYVNGVTQVARTRNPLLAAESGKDVLEKAVQKIAAEFNYTVPDIVHVDTEKTEREKVELVLNPISMEMVVFADLDMICMELENYYVQKGGAPQYTLTVEDMNGEILYYIYLDCQYGSLLVWVSPQMEASFIAQEGPVHK